MKFLEYVEKLEHIRFLAARHSTGSPSQLAARLDVSVRTVERMVQQLRDRGYSITYNRFRNSYVIDEDSFHENKKIFPGLAMVGSNH